MNREKFEATNRGIKRDKKRQKKKESETMKLEKKREKIKRLLQKYELNGISIERPTNV